MGGKDRAKNWGARAAIITASVATVMLGGSALWLRRMNAIPETPLQAPVRLSVNAADYYLKANVALVNVKAIREAAYLGKKRDPAVRVVSDGEQQKILAQNKTAFRYLKQGLTLPYYETEAVRLSNPSAFSQYRYLMGLLSLKMRIAANRSENGQIAECFTDMLRFNSSIGHGGGILAWAVTRHFETVIFDELERYEPRLSIEQRRKILQRMVAFETQAIPFHDVLNNEQQVQTRALITRFKSPNWRRDISRQLSANFIFPAFPIFKPGKWWQQAASEVNLWRYSNQQILDNYTQSMGALKVEAQKPYRERKTLSEPRDPLNPLLLNMYKSCLWQDTNSDTRKFLLTTKFALQIYKLESGSYPRSLKELVPKYLPHVPRDPFSSREVKYRKLRQGYVLYSLGPDLKDNGGKPVVSKANGKPLTLERTGAEDQGDLVAGINK